MNQENGTSVAALSYACRKGLSEIAEYLIDANAVIGKVTKFDLIV